MNVPPMLPHLPQIKCVEMHTTGEPTRIVYEGFPEMQGTLLQQRNEAKKKYDHIRKQLMLEPRGHYDMYGAFLVYDTELVRSGDAHIGVLFCHNEGFSSMCGHATIALGRFLVDCIDTVIFPQRQKLVQDLENNTTIVNLHAPCGLIRITVPTSQDGSKADSSRLVSFLSVPSFVSGIRVNIPISEQYRWPQLQSRDHVMADFSYGGAFSCLVTPAELGFVSSLAKDISIGELNRATRLLQLAVNANKQLAQAVLKHPEHDDLDGLYTIIVTDPEMGAAAPETAGVETGLCFFADQQIDRSPTGSAVAARVALAFAQGKRKIGEAWTYHSLISASCGQGAFIGTPVESLGSDSTKHRAVIVEVKGQAYYTGLHGFVVEPEDLISQQGFIFSKPSS